MSMTSEDFSLRIKQKPVATLAEIVAAMPPDERGRTTVRVGQTLVPLMPLGINRPPDGGEMANAPAGLASTGTPANVDHRVDQTPAKSQGDRPTCVSFALLAALEALIKRSQKRELDLSEHFTHWLFMSSQKKTQCETGPYTVQAAMVLHRAGVCLEALCPYQSLSQVAADCGAVPSSDARQHATFGLGSFTSLFNHGLTGWSVGNIDLLESLLAQDVDVVVGFEAIFGLFTEDGVLDIFTDDAGNPWPARAGHTMLAVGYMRDPANPYFLFKNSWLDPTGNGYMKVSYDFVRHYATCGVVPRQVRSDMPAQAGNGGPP